MPTGKDEVIGTPEQPAEIRNWPVRGLNRIQAARYIGISPTKFDELVKDGRMPRPRRIDYRRVWDVQELDMAFEELPYDGAAPKNPWDGTSLSPR